METPRFHRRQKLCTAIRDVHACYKYGHGGSLQHGKILNFSVPSCIGDNSLVSILTYWFQYHRRDTDTSMTPSLQTLTKAKGLDRKSTLLTTDGGWSTTFNCDCLSQAANNSGTARPTARPTTHDTTETVLTDSVTVSGTGGNVE